MFRPRGGPTLRKHGILAVRLFLVVFNKFISLCEEMFSGCDSIFSAVNLNTINIYLLITFFEYRLRPSDFSCQYCWLVLGFRNTFKFNFNINPNQSSSFLMGAGNSALYLEWGVSSAMKFTIMCFKLLYCIFTYIPLTCIVYICLKRDFFCISFILKSNNEFQ